MSTNLEFETPENIQVGYRPAGLGTRFVAWFVDNILLTVVVVFIFCGLICAGVVTESVLRPLEGTLRDASKSGNADEGRQIVLYFAGVSTLVWGLSSFFYFGASELFLRGQTLGKRLSGLRVVRLDGFALEAGSVLLRNIFRVIDHIPPLWIVPLVSSRSQRLGDMAAGTVVIVDKPESISNLRAVLSERAPVDAKFKFDGTMLKRVRAQDFAAVEKILERWNELPEAQQQAFLGQLVPPLVQRMQTTAPPDEDRWQFLHDLLAAEYRRQHRGLG